MASGDSLPRDMLDDSDEEEVNDDAFADWEDEEGETTPSKCLFCEEVFITPAAVFEHCKASHQFDIREACRQWNLDCFGYIKMINFVRSTNATSSACSNNNAGTAPPWASDDFMRPHDMEDGLLQYDIEEMLERQEMQTATGASSMQCNGGDLDTDQVTMSRSDHQSLLQKWEAAEQRVEMAEAQLQQTLRDLESMRLVTRDLVLAQPEVPTGEVKPTQEELEDDPYFNSYAHFSIHEEMLKDKVRTESYRDFMYKNPEVFKDKLVLDVGCGTGILSMFAARAGAKHVFAVDQSEIIYQAMDIVRENSLADKITLIRGRLEDIDLPVEKVDIIISEWMGYFLLFESMLDTVLFARDKYLKLDGAVYPDRCTISLTCISDLDLYDKHVTYWNNVYGFSMGCMKTSVVREVGVEVVKEEQIATTAVVLKELDICRCGLADLQFSKEFTLTAKSDVPITAIVGYFDTFFEEGCSDKVSFSTGPGSIPTHWKQSVFLLDTPLNVKTGEEIQGKLTCRKNRKDPRSLNITVQLKDRYLTYLME